LADYVVTYVNGTLTVSPLTLTVTAANASRVYGAANPAFSGTYSSATNGDTFLVTGTTSATVTSDVGKYPIVPSLTGTNAASYSLSLVPGTLTITQSQSLISLSSSNTNPDPNSPVAITASVLSPTTGVPTGSVTFADGMTPLGSVTLNAQGVANYTVSSFTAAGLHSITATYSGNVDFSGVTSPALIETVSAPDFSITAAPPTLTIKQGAAGSVVITVASVGGFNQPLTFSCAGQPIHASCSFTPSTLTPNGGPVSTTLTITTDTNSQSASIDPPMRYQLSRLALILYPGGPAQLAVLLCLFRLRRRPGAGKILSACLAMSLMGTVVAIFGCAGGDQVTPLTPTGVSLVTITASTAASSGLSHSAALTVTVAN
jgi:hypothetical protein